MQKANKDVEQGAFMRILLNFSEHTFYRTAPGDYISKSIYLFFWRSPEKSIKTYLVHVLSDFVLDASEKQWPN